MAKSFHTIIDDGFFEVEHLGDLVELELPEMFTEIKGLTENEEALMEWVKKHNLVLPVIQCAIQKRIIELRAIARPIVKKFKDKESFENVLKKIPVDEIDNWNVDAKNLELSLKITVDDKAQDRIDKAEWTKVNRPGMTGKGKIDLTGQIEIIAKAVKPWIELGKSVEEIKEIFDGVFSDQVLEKAIALASKS